MQHQHQLLLGAHMSVAGGYDLAFDRGQSIGCTAIQIFTKSNRQWQAKPISPEQQEAFALKRATSPIKSIIVHASYLINIGSPNKEAAHKSCMALLEELNRCHLLNIPYLVLHPGARLEASTEHCLDQIAENLQVVFKKYEGKTNLLLENASGQGSTVGYTFEQLAYIFKHSPAKKRLGVCFDTCHAFAAGYDLRTPQAYKETWEKFDEVIGLHHLKAIHLNDSKKELGCRVDRHEEIGDGKIGLEGFRLIMNDKKLFDVPKILETPKDDLEHYAQNIRVLKGLLTDESRKILGVE